jgi:hypothetical protein
MTSSVARTPGRRRSWVEPALWLGIPAFLAIGPWAAREWATTRLPRGLSPPVMQLTGDSRRDCEALLAGAWAAARTQPIPEDTPPAIVERYVHRQAGWLAEIAEQLLPLQPQQAEKAAGEAIGRLSVLPERMGPEELAAPFETPTGRLLRLANAFQAVPAVAHRARRAAWERALAAERPAGRVYALCAIARESARSEPVVARAALRRAEKLAAALAVDERPRAQAAVAGSIAVAASPAAAHAMAARVVQEAEGVSPDPETLAAIALLIAPAAPGAGRRLAELAVEHAARATVPPKEEAVFPDAFLDAPRARYRLGGWPHRVRPRGDHRAQPAGSAADAHLRRVAAVLAPTEPEAAQRAALRIQQPADRSGALTEVAALVEERDPARAAALYRLALRAADQISRPAAARRAARLRAATGLAAFDAPAALAVVEPLPPRLIALQLNEFATRLAQQEPEAALRLIERGEQSIQVGQGSAAGLFGSARAAVAARLARQDRRAAAVLVASLQGRRSVDAWLALARGLAADRGR